MCPQKLMLVVHQYFLFCQRLLKKETGNRGYGDLHAPMCAKPVKDNVGLSLPQAVCLATMMPPVVVMLCVAIAQDRLGRGY